jgi:hypothetical protein
MLTRLYYNCPNRVRVRGVKNERNGAAITDLVATWKIYDAADTLIGQGDLVADDTTDAATNDYLALIGLDVAVKLAPDNEDFEGPFILKIENGSSLGLEFSIDAQPYRGRAK